MKFSDYKYERPIYEEVKKEFISIIDKINNSCTYEEQKENGNLPGGGFIGRRRGQGLLGRGLRRGQLQVIPLEKGFTWLDAGTADSLLTAGQTIKEIQDETGRYVGCLEELGLQEGWITADHVHAIGDELSMTLYGKYLQCL